MDLGIRLGAAVRRVDFLPMEGILCSDDEPAYIELAAGAPGRAQRFGQVDRCASCVHALLGCHARRGGGVGHGCVRCSEHGQFALKRRPRRTQETHLFAGTIGENILPCEAESARPKSWLKHAARRR